MKKTAVLLLFAILMLPLAAYAGEDGAALFKAKCQMCHGADGAKNAKANLAGADVQGKSDADLQKFVAENPKHNFKSKGLTDDQIKAIVTFLRTLKK